MSEDKSVRRRSTSSPSATPWFRDLQSSLPQAPPEALDIENASLVEPDGKVQNEILDRFLKNLDVAQPPITGEGTVQPVTSIDSVSDLRYAVPKTLFSQISKAKLPPIVEDIYGKLQVARGSHIFPRGAQEQVGPFIHWSDKGDSRLFGETQYKGTAVKYPIDKVCQIVDVSQECEVHNKSDDVLRKDVVLRVLNLAERLSGLGDSIKLENIHSSAISPVSLIQRMHDFEPSSMPRKVDYCLYLSPETKTEKKIEAFLESSVPFGRSINQIDESRTHTKLPLISIKAIKSCSKRDPLVPLSIWASAGLERTFELLEGRVKEESLIPAILVSVKGPSWYVSFMHLETVPEEVETRRKLYGQIPIGSTLEVKDCCAVISSLVCLIKWAERRNRHFLETNLPHCS